MGGKNATAVLADAASTSTSRTCAAAALGQAGQRCTATSRLVVDESVAHELLDQILAGRRRPCG
jgi:aldehyde dehydrogenase (NAD+)